MNRNFIIGAVVLITLGFGVCWYSYRTENITTSQQLRGSPGGITPLTKEQKAQCGITATTTEGTYYVSGAPPLTNGNVNYTNLPGSPLNVSGHVYEGTGNTKPLANTLIDVWQTDTEGKYRPQGNGSWPEYPANEKALRGTVTTDANGYYEFRTIYPGEYTGRTRHIHVKVRSPGKEELTTQLIVSLHGDDISFDDDTFSQGLPTCHLLTLNATTPPTEATFDFRLAP